MFPYRCDTFTTANVSVLNVFKTSVDTINASSITSDMTIGANLNGGSLTLGAAGATTNVSGRIVNIANSLPENGYVKIADLTNGTGSYIVFGSETLGGNYIRGNGVFINDSGLTATGKVNIGNGTNAVGSQVTIGSSTLSTVLLNGVNVVMNDQTGSKVQIGGKDMGVMYLRAAILYINDGNNSDYINNGITIIGNPYGGRTELQSSAIYIGKDITGSAFINIGGSANTTTGYIVLGSINLDTNYIRGKNININNDGTGNVNLCNGTGTINIYSPLKVGYNPSQINNTYHIGYKFSASFFGALFNYSGGNRTFGWWYTPPGVYLISYSSMFNRTTAYYKTFIYWTTQAPNTTSYLIDMVGGGYSEASVAEWNNEAVGYHRVTGSACITLTVASYIAISQNFFYPGGPNDNVGYGIDVVRVG